MLSTAKQQFKYAYPCLVFYYKVIFLTSLHKKIRCYRKLKFIVIGYLSTLLIFGCTSAADKVLSINSITQSSSSVKNSSYQIINTTTIKADGKDIGKSAYELIEDAFGSRSIEAPDFYSNDHNEMPHIIESFDNEVGHHFVFLAHRDLDFDRGKKGDRQRNEIKVYGNSPEALKAKEGETFQYSWKFKVSSEMSLSERFSHFFQIKARNHTPEQHDNKNGNDAQPVITLSGAETKEFGQQLQVRHSVGNAPDGKRIKGTYLTSVDWSLITDAWLEVFVQTTFAEANEGGRFEILIKRVADGSTIIDISEENIDMWRGQISKDFSRPKWGIYRSLAIPESLRADEEQVKFADFTVSRVRLVRSP